MEGTEQGQRKRTYTPGAPVVVCAPKKQRCTVMHTHKRKRESITGACVSWDVLHEVILSGPVIDLLAARREPLALIMLSMLNRQFRARFARDIKLWHRMYSLWRGFMHPNHRGGQIKTARGVITLSATVPRSLPNFRDMTPTIVRLLEHNRVLRNLDRMDLDTSEEEERQSVLKSLRMIVCLTFVDRCGMCGTTRHATKPYWNIGKRLCKYCLQDNLITETTLGQRYHVHPFLSTPIQDGKSFSELIAGQVWYFKEICGPRQRMEFSNDCLDVHPAFGKSARPTWFFWLPHLETALDMPRIRREAVAKTAATEALRAYTRRMLAQRCLDLKTSRIPQAERRKHPTRAVDWRVHARAMLDKVASLKRQMLHSDSIIRAMPRWDVCILRRMNDHEDRLLPKPARSTQ